MIEVVPAILSKTGADVLDKASRVPQAPVLHIDLMDGRFVPNTTVGPEELRPRPLGRAMEYHLMVEDPLGWIERLDTRPGDLFLVHIETLTPERVSPVADAVRARGGRLWWVINPPTPLERLWPLIPRAEGVLFMTVNPGFSGQGYLAEVEGKMRQVRARYPDLGIEVDGGVSAATAPRAVQAGATKVAAASALFAQPDPAAAYEALRRLLNP